MKINKDYVLLNPKYKWLADKFNKDFEIEVDDKSKVIFGFNGIGKSSIVKCLKADTNINYRFLDYEEILFSDETKEIKIAPNILKIHDADEAIKNAEKNINYKDLIKDTGYKKGKSSDDPDFVTAYKKTITKTGDFPAELKSIRKDYEDFISKHTGTDSKVFFTVIKKLEAVSNATDEIQAYKDQKFKEFLNMAKGYVTDTDKCPLCGSYVANINKIIEDSEKKLLATKSEIVSVLEEIKEPHDTKTIEAYTDLYNDLSKSPDLFNDYVVCGNNISTFDSIESNTTNINTNKKLKSILETTRDKKYSEIKLREKSFKKDVSRYLKVPVSSIVFDDVNHEIIIKLDREVSKYSTGERHILWFLYEIYSFLGSDSPVLVLDDPASSLDLINMYKIAFEIVRNVNDPDKKILVFTHSAELVNAINSQYRGGLDVYYIEELNSELFSEKIDYNSFDEANIFTAERLKEKIPHIIDSLKLREDKTNLHDEDKVYHFDVATYSSEIDDTLTNESLVKLIDNFTGFTKIDFYTDTFNKIYHLLALRVWVEKSLYNLIPATDSERKNQFLNKNQFQDRLCVVDKRNSSYLTFKREDLMSKKAMLNQNAHYYSQVMPFAYAMNLSFDDLRKEIEEIKDLFKQ